MRTRLEPKRDGNPKALLLALYLASLVALLAVAATAEASERPLFLALVAVDALVMGALFVSLVGLPEKLFYVLEGPFLAIHHAWGQRRVHRSEVVAVVPTAYALPLLALGPKTEMPGYYRMRFRFRGCRKSPPRAVTRPWPAPSPTIVACPGRPKPRLPEGSPHSPWQDAGSAPARQRSSPPPTS
jgi:hypothetical protein